MASESVLLMQLRSVIMGFVRTLHRFSMMLISALAAIAVPVIVSLRNRVLLCKTFCAQPGRSRLLEYLPCDTCSFEILPRNEAVGPKDLAASMKNRNYCLFAKALRFFANQADLPSKAAISAISNAR
mmetsp:Transcript_42255/g.68616  ORF Transcript_42255/g.68616 Transcript_42255/m.68616 type:complete len:127 (+) Transcript_42255:29-409(+)